MLAWPNPLLHTVPLPTQVGRIVLCDMYGSRMPAVRQTVRAKIADVYKGLDTTLECYPEDHVGEEPTAYLRVSGNVEAGCLYPIHFLQHCLVRAR